MAVNDHRERRAIRGKEFFFGATFRDIWGHLGTYVPIARPAPPKNALPGAPRKSAPGSVPLHATGHARKQAKNGQQRPPLRDRASTRKDFLSVDISRLWSTLVDLCRPKPPVRGHNAMRGDSRTRRARRYSTMPPKMTPDRTASARPRPQSRPVRRLRPHRKRPPAAVRTAPVAQLQRHHLRTRPQPYWRRRARNASWLPGPYTASFTRISSASSHAACSVASVSSRTSSTRRATPARAVAVNCDHHRNQMNRSSDKCQQTLARCYNNGSCISQGFPQCCRGFFPVAEERRTILSSRGERR